MTDPSNLIPVKDALTHPNIPYTPGTLRKWHGIKKYPNLIKKVAGRLVFDLEEFARMADAVGKE